MAGDMKSVAFCRVKGTRARQGDLLREYIAGGCKTLVCDIVSKRHPPPQEVVKLFPGDHSLVLRQLIYI